MGSHGLVALVVACICGMILVGLHASDTSRKSLESSYESLRAIIEMNSEANRLSEQIAEMFAVGPEGRKEMTDSQRKLLAQIERLRAATQARLETAPPDEREAIFAMIHGIDDLTRIATAAGTAGNRVADLLDRGRLAEAQELYTKGLEDGLDSRIADIIDAEIERNARGVAAQIAASDRLTERQRLLAISIVVAGTVMAVGLALMLDRIVSRPLIALTEAADHLAAGEREIALDTRRRDELGELALSFRQMAQRINAQQAGLRAARDSLARQVAERTESLMQRSRELEVAVARLSELDSTRSRFLADISHELRTPLTVIRGQAEVAMRSPHASPEVLRAAIEAMIRRTDQLGRLVDDLLFIARSEAGSIQILPEPVMLQEILVEATMDAGSLRAADGIRIALDQPHDPLIVEADPARIHQAVMIVLHNAIQHSPENGRVAVKLRREGDMACLSVSDMGEGFHESDIPHVFDRFYRGRGGRDGKGSGLGLAIARWIVSRHDGRILIVPREPGRPGARIEIRLPLAGPGAARDGQEEAA